MNRFLIRMLAAFAVVGAIAELAARLVVGLGTPPLTIAHPTIEYMFKPNQDVYRFHNRQLYNSYGMRSPEMVGHAEHIILVFGDSVLNGGNQTDQKELATSLLQNALGAGGESVFVGNISAGSWGPGNIRAWINEYGLFDAEILIFVLSSHDIDDQPSFAPLDPATHPTTNPPLAIIDGIQRYLPKYLPAASVLKPRLEPNPYSAGSRSKYPQVSGTEDLKAILQLAIDQNVCLIQHLTLTELEHGEEAGHDQIQDVFESAGSVVIQLSSYIAAMERPDAAYRDDIHLNDVGQEYLYMAMSDCIRLVEEGASHDGLSEARSTPF